jgi:hypothetical protein
MLIMVVAPSPQVTGRFKSERLSPVYKIAHEIAASIDQFCAIVVRGAFRENARLAIGSAAEAFKTPSPNS